MKKFLLLLTKLVRVRVTITAGSKITNLTFGKAVAKWTIVKAAVTVLTFGIIINIAI